jgi:hypothetical protein
MGNSAVCDIEMEVYVLGWRKSSMMRLQTIGIAGVWDRIQRNEKPVGQKRKYC